MKTWPPNCFRFKRSWVINGMCRNHGGNGGPIPHPTRPQGICCSSSRDNRDRHNISLFYCCGWSVCLSSLMVFPTFFAEFGVYVFIIYTYSLRDSSEVPTPNLLIYHFRPWRFLFHYIALHLFSRSFIPECIQIQKNQSATCKNKQLKMC